MLRAHQPRIATRYVWWFFQIQPYPIPEHLIGLDPEFYLREHLGRQCKTRVAVTDDALAEYLRCLLQTRPRSMRRARDYRAAAGVGLELDAADAAAGRTIAAPLLALWGARGMVGQLYDVWRHVARLGRRGARRGLRLRALASRGSAQRDVRRTDGVLRHLAGLPVELDAVFGTQQHVHVLRTSAPIVCDVFTGFRVQHNIARGPCRAASATRRM